MSLVQTYENNARRELFDTRMSTVMTLVTVVLYCGVFGLAGYSLGHDFGGIDALTEIFFAR